MPKAGKCGTISYHEEQNCNLCVVIGACLCSSEGKDRARSGETLRIIEYPVSKLDPESKRFGNLYKSLTKKKKPDIVLRVTITRELEAGVYAAEGVWYPPLSKDPKVRTLQSIHGGPSSIRTVFALRTNCTNLVDGESLTLSLVNTSEVYGWRLSDHPKALRERYHVRAEPDALPKPPTKKEFYEQLKAGKVYQLPKENPVEKRCPECRGFKRVLDVRKNAYRSRSRQDKTKDRKIDCPTCSGKGTMTENVVYEVKW